MVYAPEWDADRLGLAGGEIRVRLILERADEPVDDSGNWCPVCPCASLHELPQELCDTPLIDLCRVHRQLGESVRA